MAKKPKERKGYFYEREEQAIIDYINATNAAEKDKIFRDVLYNALTIMIESIIRRYKLYVPDEEFEQTFTDTMSYLLTKINNFKPNIIVYEEFDSITEAIAKESFEIDDSKYNEYVNNPKNDSPKYLKVNFFGESGKLINIRYYKKVEKHYKAYSYCGTVCKNYLLYKNMQFIKNRDRNTSYETCSESFENNIRYSDGYGEGLSVEALLSATIMEINKMIDDPVKYNLSPDEIKAGIALVDLMERWEDLVMPNGSNKLQKSNILYFLREQTMMTTKEFRDNMKKYKTAYYALKKMMIEN